ncbi:MAG: trigger factor [Candidatus Promineifilaceae bacterium]
MTLTIHKEEDDQRQLKVTVEVPESRVQNEVDQLIRRLSREVQIPGFRRGKVPKNVIYQRFGGETLRGEAIEGMLETLLTEVMDEIDVDEIAQYQPVMDEMHMEPLVLELTVPLKPVVTLGDYRAIRKELDPIEVTDEAMEDALDHIRSHHQVLEDVDRPSEAGDMLTITGEGKTTEDDEVFWHVHDTEILLDSEKAFPGLPIVDNLIGTSAEEDIEFTFTFPEDYEEEELAGKEALMSISIEKVQSRFLPELDDELAQKEGDFETVEDLKESLKDELYEQAKSQAQSTLIDEMIDEMMEDVELVYPPAAVENEINRFLEDMKTQVKNASMEWNDFLRTQELTEEAYREQWREAAERNVRRGLTLRQFVEEEKIKVTDADIDAALEDRLEKFGDNEELREQLRNIFMQGRSFESMSQAIIEEKVYERVKAIVTGNAPDLASLEEEDEAVEDEEE